MDTTNMSPFVRVDVRVAKRGLEVKTAEDKFLKRSGKTVNETLYEEADRLQKAQNALLSSSKRICGAHGSVIDHPQGFIATLADTGSRGVPTLVSVMGKCKTLAAEAARINSVIASQIHDGSWDEWLKNNPEFQGKRPRHQPCVQFSATMAVDTRHGQKTDDIIADLKANGVYFPEIIPTILVPRQDEKLLEVLEAVAKMITADYGQLAEKVRKNNRSITKDDILKANNKVAHSLDQEREKFRAILGPGEQTDQLDAVIDRLLKGSTDIIDVFEEIKLFDGAPASEAVDVRKYSAIGDLMNDDDIDVDVNDI